LGDAKSLLGGTLLVTPLLGADGEAYAVAQGTVQTGAVSAQGASGSAVTRGVPTSGRIAAGAVVEREVSFQLSSMSQLRLTLKNPDFTTARRIADVINTSFPGSAASDNPTIVTLHPPAGMDMVSFVTTVEQMQVEPDSPARVVIDEVSGVIVMGSDVRVSTVAIAQGNLTISVQETPQVSQPAPFSQGQTTVTPKSAVSIDEEKGKRLLVVKEGASLATLTQRTGRDPSRHDFHPADHQGRRRPTSRHSGDVMTPVALPVTPAQAAAAAMTPAQQATARAKISETSKKFEASFLSSMLQSVFKDVDMGGGEGGEAFKSIMMDAVGKQIAEGHGVGLAKSVQAEMLKLQGLA
jgi:hypothetical protein